MVFRKRDGLTYWTLGKGKTCWIPTKIIYKQPIPLPQSTETMQSRARLEEAEAVCGRQIARVPVKPLAGYAAPTVDGVSRIELVHHTGT